MRTSSLMLVFVVTAAGVLSGCSPRHYFNTARPIAGPDNPPGPISAEEPRVVPVFAGSDGTPLGWEDVLQAAAWADVIIIGEQHDDAVGHAVQRAVVEDVMARFDRSALSVEMLERDEQIVVDDYLEGLIDAETLAKLTHSEGWGGGDGSWEDWYQPIIDAARDAGGDVVAANAPRRYVKLARMRGYGVLADLPPHRRKLADRPRRMLGGQYRQRFFDLMMEQMEEAAKEAEMPAAEGEEPADAPHAMPEAPAGMPPAGMPPSGMPPTAEEAPEEPAAPTRMVAEPDAAKEAAPDDVMPPPHPGARPADAMPPADADASDENGDKSDEDAAEDAEEEMPRQMPLLHGGPDLIEMLYRSQLVWDTTMAGSIAKARQQGARKVIHLVGQFHCDFEGGTVQQLRKFRPFDRILVISMQRAEPSELREEDLGRADIIIYTGERPPEEEEEEPAEAETDEEKPAETEVQSDSETKA
ncbi:MAG: ChaN family lipoprotein [Phycisphaerales bacterium]|nr:MAG: ChaN family lipoprotein [Phycisphaerales bacterium]